MNPTQLFCDTVLFYNRKLQAEPETLKIMAKNRGISKWSTEDQISWIAVDLAMEIEKINLKTAQS